MKNLCMSLINIHNQIRFIPSIEEYKAAVEGINLTKFKPISMN